MNVCHLCGGERRVYSCWDEAKCPMAQDGGCDDCASRCPECAGAGTALPTRCDIGVSALREGLRQSPTSNPK